MAVASGARLFKACEVIGLGKRRYRRWINRISDDRGGYRAKHQALTQEEKDEVIRLFSKPEFTDLPVKVVHALLMDQGILIASVSTCERIMIAYRKSRKVLGKSMPKKRPELSAKSPCEVWCWDITWLHSEVAGKYYYLYLIIDMYSRFIVGWDVYTKEDGALARSLFEESIAEHCPENPASLLVHADNGRPMKSCNLKTLFEKLHVQSSHSRPHTSNDNAYAESIFSTMKGRVLYPEFFTSIEAAIEFVSKFVEWYNYEHLHSGLDMSTPCSVHYDFHKEIMEKRNQLLEEARQKHPSRFGSKKKIFAIPSEVTLKHQVSLKKAG